MIKKILSIVMLVSLTTTLLLGFTMKTAKSEKDVTLTIWQTPADVKQSTLALQDGFKKAYPNIKLNIVQTPQNADLLAAIAAGNAPSVAASGYPGFTTLIYQGAFLPIDEYIAKTPDFKNFDSVQVKTFSQNGKHYGIPGDKYALAIQYHKSLFAAAGITSPPKTWDEFLKVAKKLTIPEKQQYGFALDGTQWACWHFEIWTWAAGGDLTKKNPDGTLKLTFTDPAVIKAAEFYRKLEKANVIQPDRTMQLDGLNKDFALSKAAMSIGLLGNASNVSQQGGKAEDIGFFNFPVGPSGKGYDIDGGDGMGIVYTKDKAVADAAWKYMMYINSKKAVTSIYKEIASQGPWAPIIPNRTDIDMKQFGKVDPAVQKVMNIANIMTKHEFYGKGAVGQFADDMVSKIFGDTNADIKTTFKAAQDKAAQAVLDFNKAILSAKK